MKSPDPLPCGAWNLRDIVSGIVLSTCVTVAFLAAPILSSAQNSQPSSTKSTKTVKQVKTVQPAKSTDSAKPTKEDKLTAVPPIPTRYARKQQAEYGREARDEALDMKLNSDSPDAAAREAYAARAYPAAYVPHQLTVNARKGWVQLKSADASSKLKSKLAAATKTWTIMPQVRSEFPQILSFSGAPYLTSGRITALAISSTCQPGNCRVWSAAAGGGIWRTDDALASTPAWTFISSSFATNAIGALTYDAGTGTLYAGTGEANASADSEAGFGIYMSTDGGDNWTHLAGQTSVASGMVDCTAVLGTGGMQTAPAYTGPAFDGRAISSIVISGSTM